MSDFEDKINKMTLDQLNEELSRINNLKNDKSREQTRLTNEMNDLTKQAKPYYDEMMSRMKRIQQWGHL